MGSWFISGVVPLGEIAGIAVASREDSPFGLQSILLDIVALSKSKTPRPDFTPRMILRTQRAAKGLGERKQTKP